MEPGGRTIIRRWPDTSDQRERLRTPRDDVVADTVASESAATITFVQDDGPFTAYERTVTVDDGELVEATRYRIELPWFGWLFARPVHRVLARRGSYQEWWAPPDRLDPTQVLVIGLMAAASMSAAFVNTLFTQTVNFAADEFGVSDTGIGVAGSVVRAGVVFALPMAVLADRVGRRRVMIWMAWLGPGLSVLGALAPTFEVLVATQTLARPAGIALAFLVGVVVTEEMPRNSRAYAVSVLAMAAGFGAGIAVLSLRFADIGDSGWRYVYVVGAIWCLVAVDLTRRLPETRRFLATRHTGPVPAAVGPVESAPVVASPHRRGPRLNRRRLLLLSVVAMAGNLFVSPASFFQNRYLTDIRDFSGGLIGIFSIAVGTPAALGLIIGGRVADTRGRRWLIAVTLPLGTAALVVAFGVGGPLLWISSLVGGLLSSAAYPALAVYRGELFPTSNRGKASGLVTAAALLGGIVGLLVTGTLLDAGWSYLSIMGTLALGQVVVAVLVLVAYPETAHHELEDLNPEDAPIDLHERRATPPSDPNP